MIRLDVNRFRAYARRPATLAAIAAVNMIAAPLFVWAVLRQVHAPSALEQGLVLMAAAPMISSAIALAAILELDTALAVAVMVATYAVAPLTLPVLSLWLIDLEIDAGEIFARLFGLVAGPAFAAFILRRWRPVRSARYARAIDGIGVLAVVAFCLGIMSGLQNFALENPGYVGLTLAAAFAANIGLQALAAALFLRMGRREALTVGLVTGNTNLGLVMVTLADGGFAGTGCVFRARAGADIFSAGLRASRLPPIDARMIVLRMLDLIGARATWMLAGGVFLASHGSLWRIRCALAGGNDRPQPVAVDDADRARAARFPSEATGTGRSRVRILDDRRAAAALGSGGLTGTGGALGAGIVFHALTTPIMSAPALCLLFGLDAALALAVTVLSYALVPFTLPPWRCGCWESNST